MKIQDRGEKIWKILEWVTKSQYLLGLLFHQCFFITLQNHTVLNKLYYECFPTCKITFVLYEEC